MPISSLPLLGVLAVLGLTLYRWYGRKNQFPLPPGPKRLPLLGNIRDFPPSDGTPEHLHWLKHKDLYGGISSVTVMGMTLIIIHDKSMAHELLDKMASKTSGRPTMVMANKLCGYENIVLCQGYTPTFRRYRKFLHQELGTIGSAAQFRSAQESEVARQLVRSIDAPDRWLENYKTYVQIITSLPHRSGEQSPDTAEVLTKVPLELPPPQSCRWPTGTPLSHTNPMHSSS